VVIQRLIVTVVAGFSSLLPSSTSLSSGDPSAGTCSGKDDDPDAKLLCALAPTQSRKCVFITKPLRAGINACQGILLKLTLQF